VGNASHPPKTLEEIMKSSYEKNINDEFIEPTAVSEPHPIKDNDAIIFFNFREDSMRQITEPFVNNQFDKFPRRTINNLFIATMTAYKDGWNAAVAFPPEKIENPLGKVLSQNNLTQLRIAETEKYAHVTYFFNGLQEEPFTGEYRILIPSRSVSHHDAYPEMMASQITDRVLIALNEGGFDFILVNYANPDIIAHTGNFEATVQAVKAVDREIGRLLKTALEKNHVVFITADHGNAEKLLDLQSGEPETKHDINPVPFYLVAKEYQKKQPAAEFALRLPVIGILADVAPTILDVMKIKKPAEMTGESLLDQLLYAQNL
jgi:2,3-bisphosphoglycerate-independent phosphoglycerate mutase